MVAGQELTYNTSASAFQMAGTIMGDGVTVTGASYTGANGASAMYSNGDTISDFVTPGDTGVILSTGSATRFTNNASQSNLATNTSSNTTGPDGEPGFDALVTGTTFDAAFLDIDFLADPNMDTMTIQFVFSSDEYPEYSNSIYNDTVGVWINGANVPLAIGNGATAVGSVNQNNNINIYNDNTADQYNTEMDGFTLTMTLTIPINPGGVNSLRIGIADTADANYDSNLLIAADSVQTMLIADQDFVTMREGVTKTVDILGNDINNTAGSLVITHINGVELTGTTGPITLPTGQQVVVNANGTIDITTDNDFETSSFTYEIASVDTNGTVLETDVGFVTVETIPCFVAGTMIETQNGEQTVETLIPGDMIRTRDEGYQPLRWIGQRSVPATGRLAPILIRAGALGNHNDVRLSPLHRVLLRDAAAELLFGEAEVLVTARDLINDCTIRPMEGGTVQYVHLLFDSHQVIYSDGLATESYLPGPQTSDAFDPEIVEEICSIFPELNPRTGEGYGPAARPLLKRFEAAALLRGIA